MKNWWGKYKKGDKFQFTRQADWNMNFSVTIAHSFILLGYYIKFIDGSGRWISEAELDQIFFPL